MTKTKNTPLPVALLCNIMLSYIVLMLCRLVFLAVNYDLYSECIHENSLTDLLSGSLLFDTSAICYINIPYILALLFPLHYKEGCFMQSLTKILYVAGNALSIIANFADTVYVPFTGRRSTWSLFTEFSNEGNIAQIIGLEIINHWYLTLGALLLIWLVNKLYRPVKTSYETGIKSYYVTRIITLAIVAPLLIFGIRGGIGATVRPITISNANQYVNKPNEAALVLNTPFSMIRTIGKSPFTEKNFFTKEEVEHIYSPLHTADNSKEFVSKNVVIFILESFGKDYIGAYNPERNTASLTPFLDSLITESRTFAYSYGNGRKSIDGMPSVLSSIPMFIEPFFVTTTSLNRVSGIAGELKNKGYETAFFHGAPGGSMGFRAFSRTTGFQRYYGMEDYELDKSKNGKNDFDGTWAIWDEPFFEFYAETMDTIREPFMTALFSASSHHPFRIPEKYADSIKEGALPIHKCITYTDKALRAFFEKAKKEKWFDNTLFVITADHSNQTESARYKTSSGFFEVPVIFYSPDKTAPFAPGMDSCTIAQQTDIMPTVLDYLGYDKEYVAFGKSLVSDSLRNNFAVNYINDTYQYYKDEYLLLFDGEKSVALYNIREDNLLKKNLAGSLPEKEKEMEREIKAIIQQYMYRMLNDKLVP